MDEINTELLDPSSPNTQLLSFYDGSKELYYDHKLHVRYYVEDDAKILVAGATNVTGVMDKSGPLTQWAANETCNYLRTLLKPGEVYTQEQLDSAYQEARFNYRKISRIATDIGHEAHDWLDKYQRYLMSGRSDDALLLPEHPKVKNCVEAAIGWMKTHLFHPLKVECQTYSRLYEYCGTYDHLAEITSCGDPTCCPFQGRITILGDFKSSKRIYDEYRMQTAAYKAGHEEEYPDQRVDARVIIRLDKEGDGIETLTLMNDSYEDDLSGFLGLLDAFNWQKKIDLQEKYERAVAKQERTLAKEAAAAIKAAERALKGTRPRAPRKKTVIREVAVAGIPVEV